MYDSINSGKLTFKEVTYPYGSDLIMRDIKLNPLSHTDNPKDIIERFFLFLKIKQQETASIRGKYYRPNVNLSNFFSQNSKPYTCTYKDFTWREKTSDIKLTIYSTSDQTIKLYESFSELDTGTDGNQVFLFDKAGNRIEVTMNKSFAEEFKNLYAFFLK